MNTRVWRALETDVAHGPACEGTLRCALVLWMCDPTSALTDVQRAWLCTRLQPRPLTPQEQRKIIPPLLAWSRGQAWEAALVRGLRGVVEPGLLPADAETII